MRRAGHIVLFWVMSPVLFSGVCLAQGAEVDSPRDAAPAMQQDAAPTAAPRDAAPAMQQDASPTAAPRVNNRDAVARGDLPYELTDIGVEERLGELLPLDAVFQDEAGQDVRIGDFFDGETPIVVNFVYHSCPMLCGLTLDGITDLLRELEWLPGKEFRVLTVSFAEEDTPELAAASKARHLAKLGRTGAGEGWHFLTGSEESIREMTRATGYSFKWMEKTQDYAHPAVLIFAAGDGTITRYIPGMTYRATDVRRALVETSNGKVGSAVDQILLFCYRYDPDANSYVLHATNLMKLAGFLTVLVVGAGLFVMWRREGHRQDDGFAPRAPETLTTETT